MSGFSGAVLTGGRSSRFAQDKAEYVYRGKPLAAWVLGSLVHADERFIVSSRPYDFDVPVYPDRYPGSSLGGLHTALSHAAHDWVAVAACDMPFLTLAYWDALLQRHGEARAAVVTGPDGLEPLAALYHKSLAGLAERQLKVGDLKMQTFVAAAEARLVPWQELGVTEQTFLNANRLSDLP